MRTPSSCCDLVYVAADVHWAVVADDIVVLDAPQDRYLCLPGAAEALQLSACRRRVTIADAAWRDDLLQAGLVSMEAAAGVSPWRPVAAPRASALPEFVESPRTNDLVEIGWAIAELLRSYWRRAFLELVRAAEMRAAPGSASDPADLTRIAAEFQRWAPYAPTSAKCLLRAFLLLRLLQRHGHHARWVFGVRTWPFEAHCWLQVGDLVLDDDVERVRALEPILVIG